MQDFSDFIFENFGMVLQATYPFLLMIAGVLVTARCLKFVFKRILPGPKRYVISAAEDSRAFDKPGGLAARKMVMVNGGRADVYPDLGIAKSVGAGPEYRVHAFDLETGEEVAPPKGNVRLIHPIKRGGGEPLGLTHRNQGSQPRRLETIRQAHEEVLTRWRVYELDIAAMIDYPSMSDVRVPETAAMVRAMRAAMDARDGGVFEEYRAAVRQFEIAFDAAEHEARERAVSTLPEADRTRLSQAKNLLAIAENAAATEAERQTAYSRLRRVLDGLIKIPQPALAELEHKMRLQLSSVHNG